MDFYLWDEGARTVVEKIVDSRSCVVEGIVVGENEQSFEKIKKKCNKCGLIELFYSEACYFS